MLFKINSVQFDFDDGFEDGIYAQEIITDTLETIWEAIDGDDLIEEITNCTGWCIKSIDYNNVD